ncbi:MAG: hypothetical protein ATN35_07100 [Epulopiscium sp. Nele67-Bin004]|nr:MAG: hypothetical protein ATN35_07100 [Epulopiscium sp. Nele67-Bin004]
MKHKLTTRELVILSALIALEIILSRFLSIIIGSLIKISFSFVATCLMATMFGPLWTAVGCGVADIIGATLFPIGSYHPGFTVSSMISGALYGIFLYRKSFKLQSVILREVISTLVISIGLNPLWLSHLYGNPYLVTLGRRIPAILVMTPIQIVLVSIVWKFFIPQLSKLRIISSH